MRRSPRNSNGVKVDGVAIVGRLVKESGARIDKSGVDQAIVVQFPEGESTVSFNRRMAMPF